MLILWLAMIGVLLAFDILASKCRRNRKKLIPAGRLAFAAGVFTFFSVAADIVATHLLVPALGAGINFYFAG
jgi:uncharacterized membrane protein YbhN (UPF0104 family)